MVAADVPNKGTVPEGSKKIYLYLFIFCLR